MRLLPRADKRISSLLTTLGVIAALVACSHPTEQESTNSPATQPQSPASASASTAGPVEYDISRVANVQDDMPRGFDVEAPSPKTLSQQDIDASELTRLTGASMNPAQCRAAIIPSYADPSVGTEAAGIEGVSEQGILDVVAFRSPEPIPVNQPPAGCDRVAISGSPETTGTAERVPAPEIDGVITTGYKLTTPDEQEDPEYIFTAALNDQISVVVRGGTDADLNPQQVMSDLLVKATAAVRGR